MAIDEREQRRDMPEPRATRCQLLLALLFLIGVSAIGWFVVGSLLLG